MNQILFFILTCVPLMAQVYTTSGGKIGTKPINEADIGDGKVLAFDQSNNWLEYVASGVASSVNDSNVVFTYITDGNVSTSNHGFAPKLSNTSTEYLSGTGVYSTPAGGGGTSSDFGVFYVQDAGLVGDSVTVDRDSLNALFDFHSCIRVLLIYGI